MQALCVGEQAELVLKVGVFVYGKRGKLQPV